VNPSVLRPSGLMPLKRQEISGITGLTGDLEQASSGLRDFLKSLNLIQDPGGTSTLILSDLTACPAIWFPLDQASNYPDLLKIYNQLADNWIASLPLKVSAQARLSKFKIIRQIALELCLSSLAVSLRNKATNVAFATSQDADGGLALPEFDKEDGTIRESSPSNFSSQLASLPERELDLNLLTPAQTPSLYSHATSASDLREDPATSRLRQYAVSINSKPDFAKPQLLSHWPSTPGGDPAQYSWEATKRAEEEDESGGESEQRTRKDEARRRRRTEKFLRQETARAAEAISQPIVVISSGSQPIVAHNGFSSQTVDDIPMTQPDRGAFGSRSTQKDKKKPKKHRTAGF
jgi:RNA polymerase I-specific transcription initiation factor RRN6